VVSAENDHRIAALLAGLCPRQEDDSYPFEDCCRNILNYICRFSGKTLTPLLLRIVAETVAGFGTEFSLGHRLRIWDPTQGSWAVLVVEDIKRIQEDKGRWLCSLSVRAGPAVGNRLTQSFKGSFLTNVMRSTCGSRYAKHNPYDFGGTWLNAWLQSQAGRFRLEELSGTDKIISINRKLLKQRKGQCIGGFVQDNCVPLCPFGRDRCRLSRHQETYRIGACLGMQRPHRGPIVHRGYCLRCTVLGLVPPLPEDE
jgi:hypothetical protein